MRKRQQRVCSAGSALLFTTTVGTYMQGYSSRELVDACHVPMEYHTVVPHAHHGMTNLTCTESWSYLRMQSLLLPSAWPVDDPSNDQSG